MSAECPGCWPTPKLPITRVFDPMRTPTNPDEIARARDLADKLPPEPITRVRAHTHAWTHVMPHDGSPSWTQCDECGVKYDSRPTQEPPVPSPSQTGDSKRT